MLGPDMATSSRNIQASMPKYANKFNVRPVSLRDNRFLAVTGSSQVVSKSRLDEWSAADARGLKRLVSKVKLSKPVIVFRPVRLEEAEVVTTFDASLAKERKGRSQRGFMASICTLVEFSITVISPSDMQSVGTE